MSLSTIRKMTLRLNMEEPKQAEIYQILTNLDKYIYKSQNQFLVDALQFYIEHSGKDMLRQQEQCEQQRYITAEELEQIKKELREELLAIAPVFTQKPYFLSDEFSLVDCYLAPLLWRLPVLGVELVGAGAKELKGYMTRVFERDSFLASLTEAEREMRLGRG